MVSMHAKETKEDSPWTCPGIELQPALGKRRWRRAHSKRCRVVRWLSRKREAFGVRPIYRRFTSGAGRPAVYGPIVGASRKMARLELGSRRFTPAARHGDQSRSNRSLSM